MISLIFAICFVSTLGIGSLLLSNIAFIPLVVKESSARLTIKKNNALRFYLVFLGWTIISTFVFSIQYGMLSTRTLIQLFFNVLYGVWFLDVKINWKKLEGYIIFFSYILGAYIVFLYFKTGMFKVPINIFFSVYREWAIDYLPNWPNDIGVPLLFSCFLVLKSDKKTVIDYVGLLFLMCALLLTTSRTSALGCIIIVCYFIYLYRYNRILKYILGAFACVGLLFVFYNIFNNSDYDEILRRLTSSGDRMDIFRVCRMLICERPFGGYGSHTLDEILPQFNFPTLLDWPHTHNTVLELLIRYGIVGTFFYLAMLLSLYKGIKANEAKFGWFFFWFISLFQIFFRTFTFIFIIFYFINYDRDEVEV